MKITHLTSVHSRNDTRIYLKQCRSLAMSGFTVNLVVADGMGEEYKDNVRIVDVGFLPGRINRIFRSTRRILEKAIDLDSDLYHFHDPELIFVGLELKRLGKRVIFDCHEDVPKQVLSKPYLNPFLLSALSNAYAFFERYICPRFDGIIAATPHIREKFERIHPLSLDINNFPLVNELQNSISWASKQNEVCYVGGIGSIRGIREIVHSLEFLQSGCRLNLVGLFSEPAVEAEVKSYSGWRSVNELGFLDRLGVKKCLAQSMAGLVTFLPMPNHIDAQPNKLFEYMSSGIPVIASDFPLWREIVESNDCGLCVDPLDPKAIAEAIDFIINNPERAREMGGNGRRAVLERYNWDVEEAKLLAFYDSVLKR